jgi:hypothetical protein
MAALCKFVVSVALIDNSEAHELFAATFVVVLLHARVPTSGSSVIKCPEELGDWAGWISVTVEGKEAEERKEEGRRQDIVWRSHLYLHPLYMDPQAQAIAALAALAAPPPPSGGGGGSSADLDEIKKMLGSIMANQNDMSKRIEKLEKDSQEKIAAADVVTNCVRSMEDATQGLAGQVKKIERKQVETEANVTAKVSAVQKAVDDNGVKVLKDVNKKLLAFDQSINYTMENTLKAFKTTIDNSATEVAGLRTKIDEVKEDTVILLGCLVKKVGKGSGTNPRKFRDFKADGSCTYVSKSKQQCENSVTNTFKHHP